MDMQHVQVKTKSDNSAQLYTYQVLMSEGAALSFLTTFAKKSKTLNDDNWQAFYDSRDDVLLHDYVDNNGVTYPAMALEDRDDGVIEMQYMQRGVTQDPHDAAGFNLRLEAYDNMPVAAEMRFYADSNDNPVFNYRTNGEEMSPRTLKGDILINPVDGKPYPEFLSYGADNLIDCIMVEGNFVNAGDENKIVTNYNQALKAYREMKKSGVDIFAALQEKPSVTVHPKADQNKPA